jgi:hypothetical protein
LMRDEGILCHTGECRYALKLFNAIRKVDSIIWMPSLRRYDVRRFPPRHISPGQCLALSWALYKIKMPTRVLKSFILKRPTPNFIIGI